MNVYDCGRKSLELGPPLFEGGEGVICALNTLPGRLAKLYRPEKRADKENKLIWMTANPPVDPSRGMVYASIAWPEALLYENDGSFAGYVMPYVPSAKTLLHALNPSLRERTLPAFDQRYLHRVARNLATALNALHGNDYVVGDLNENNILVAQTALVTVIDVDSFQVKEKHAGQITFYPCPVGRPEYTPPELQGRSFANEVRQPEQDTFGLAVLIFQLLMNGSHPFRSIWLGQGDPPQMGEKILQGFFPYASRPLGPVKPPPGLSLDRLHPTLAGLMQRCFVDGQANPRLRPSACEWADALKEAEKALYTCSCGFVQATHLTRCPRCGKRSSAVINIHLPANVAILPAAQPAAAAKVTPAWGLQPPGAINVASALLAKPSGQSISCPVCGAANPPTRVYCLKCADRLHPPAACPKCGQLTAQGSQAKFCEACGQRL